MRGRTGLWFGWRRPDGLRDDLPILELNFSVREAQDPEVPGSQPGVPGRVPFGIVKRAVRRNFTLPAGGRAAASTTDVRFQGRCGVERGPEERSWGEPWLRVTYSEPVIDPSSEPLARPTFSHKGRRENEA